MTLPHILAGPFVRRAEPSKVSIWLATSDQREITCIFPELACNSQSTECVRLGEQLYVWLICITPENDEFPTGQLIHYLLRVEQQAICLKHLAYVDKDPAFIIPGKLSQILHGSCRNPHHHSDDALVSADNWQNQQRNANGLGADILLMSGDQIYADDVSGPTIQAIKLLQLKLGIYTDAAPVGHEQAFQALAEADPYCRSELLPVTPWQALSKRSLGYWLRQDVEHFSSVHAGNHLTQLAEFISLYLLSYSSICWDIIENDWLNFKSQNGADQQIYTNQLNAVKQFIKGLTNVERLMANVSSLMMFDDHDVTDDWNLTPNWEEQVMAHDLSRRVICNGLMAYHFFQGWGNDHGQFSQQLNASYQQQCHDEKVDMAQCEQLLLNFSKWHTVLDCQPGIIVMDTRTHRWRSEHNFNEPSGLMDWESLQELELNMRGREEVILVSPAPVFGVKAIEAIQAMFNFCGYPLTVDVENWMAHEGAAKKLLRIFKRADTPIETLILSGDVHYSFCFSVQQRFSERENRIWQLTSSGIKNEFPRTLLRILDKLDTILYAPYSPLNLFTKRWMMKVEKHKLHQHHQVKGKPYLVSNSAISLVTLNEEGKLARYQLIHGSGAVTEFDLKTRYP